MLSSSHFFSSVPTVTQSPEYQSGRIPQIRWITEHHTHIATTTHYRRGSKEETEPTEPAQGCWTRQDQPHCSQRIGRCHLPSCNKDLSSFIESSKPQMLGERYMWHLFSWEERSTRPLTIDLSLWRAFSASKWSTYWPATSWHCWTQSSLWQAAWIPLRKILRNTAARIHGQRLKNSQGQKTVWCHCYGL